MIPQNFQRAVVRTVLEDAAVTPVDAIEEDVQDFVRLGIADMPPVLRAGVISAGVMLAIVCWARTGSPFRRLGKDRRRAMVRSWASSRLPPAAQYARLIRSLVFFSAHEHPATAVRT